MDDLNKMIGQLEGALNLSPGQIPPEVVPPASTKVGGDAKKKEKASKKEKAKAVKAPKVTKGGKGGGKPTPPPADYPSICQIEFKVGKIVKVWPHENADKLWCEEIDVGEDEPRKICSGLRPFYTEEQMLGHRLLVVANLKAKNLKGFKSHGMVLCASKDDKVQFIEPPEGAPLGEVVQFEGLPPTHPNSAAQVEKKKIFMEAAKGMVTNDAFEGTFEGHRFMT
eukprot:CAMPEP_0118642276 /NCGR_PEP_ID=MMETSP0785-20121206/5751_1 /TAXON_ID=91992 /ORGANISM="Bolidomonas pacifica, Strain CCMP 1866" /LENGTH=223 /DNA_ID=CAMNT_0006533821 /DNA_START=109 /DNA_END=777 /DNA_ORIENTATION=+